MGGLEATMGKLAIKKVGKTQVRVATSGGLSMGLYLDGAQVIFVIPLQSADPIPIVTSLIKANG